MEARGMRVLNEPRMRRARVLVHLTFIPATAGGVLIELRKPQAEQRISIVMNWFTGLATFMILWWLSLFIVLPIGVRGQAEAHEVSPGNKLGAPTGRNMARKALWATGLFDWSFLSHLLSWSLVAADLGSVLGAGRFRE